jgi:hypothetical protein
VGTHSLGLGIFILLLAVEMLYILRAAGAHYSSGHPLMGFLNRGETRLGNQQMNCANYQLDSRRDPAKHPVSYFLKI